MGKWRKRQVEMVERRQARVIRSAVNQMEEARKKAVEQIWTTYEKTGAFVQPGLNDMFSASDDFYRDVLETAYSCTQSTKNMQKGKKNLAKVPWGLPKNLKNLEQLFRDKRYWPKVMKRSKILTESLRKQYLQKLRKKFAQVVPKILDGEINPGEAKKQMMETWNSSKPRVETIFRTETTNYFSKTQVAFFDSDDDIIGFMFDAVKDTGTTGICKARHGLVYRPGTKALQDNTPALHYNCRSHLIPLANIPENRKLLSDPSRDPKNRSVPPLPPGWRK